MMSAHPPYGVPATLSSLMVMAIGLSEVTVVPEGCWEESTEDARPLHVCPLWSKMVNALLAGWPIMAFLGLMVTVVLSSVATMSKDEVDCE